MEGSFNKINTFFFNQIIREVEKSYVDKLVALNL